MANFTVTFSNESQLAAGHEPTLHDVEVPVDFGFEITPETLEEYVERLCEFAAELWDEVDWELDEPGWEVVSITLPSGDVVDL